MSQKTDVALNNLQIDLAQIRGLEKKMNDLAKEDTTTVAALRAVQMDIKFKMGQFDQAFQELLKEEGMPDNFHLLDLVVHFYNESKKRIVLP